LLLERGGIGQRSAPRRLAELIVRNAAPQKERQPRSQIEIAEAIDGSRGRARRLALDAKEEARRGQDPFDPALDAGGEAAACLAEALAKAGLSCSVELDERLHVRLGDGPPIRARRDRRQDLSRTGLFLGGGRACRAEAR